MKIPRNQISEKDFDKLPDTLGSQFRKTNLKTEVCSCSGSLSVAMLWIKEVEVAKSVDDLMTSQSIGGNAFPNSDMLDAKIASALRRIISNQYSRKRIHVEERETQG